MKLISGLVAAWSLVAAPAVAQDLSLPGPYQAAFRAATVARPGGGSFTARLYHPATAAGQNQPLDASGAPYPAISFGHGFLQPVDRYHSTLQHLATWGYLVIAPESEGGLFPSHANFAADLRHALTHLEQQHTQPAAFLFNAVATDRFGVSGHSMGGGCSILAAAADQRIRALANLAAAETNPSAVAQAPALRIPVSLIAGSADSIVPLASHGQLMYNAAPAPRQVPLIQGGFHCGFQDVSSFGCDSGSLPRAEQLAITRRLLTAFFNLHLRADQSAWVAVWGPAREADPRVTTTADPGSTLAPPVLTLARFGGKTAVGLLTLTNTGPLTTAYDLLPESAQWPVAAVPPQTAPLAPGASAQVEVSIQVPPGYLPATHDLLVTARSLADGATRSFATITARRRCQADFDGSGAANVQDFGAFLNAFASGDPDCDIDNSGSININDFSAFLNAFATGCG